MESPATVATASRGKVLPLNSIRLTKHHLQAIANTVGALAMGPREQLEILVAEKLREMEEPHNC